MKLTVGRGPAGMAAACVYISSKLMGDYRTQNDIAKTAHVTEVTIRNRYKEIVTNLDIKMNL
jgi:transcription initiation factor TFIIB